MRDITEHSTSKRFTFINGSTPLDVHYNDCGHGDEVIVLLHGSGPGATGWSNFGHNVPPLVDAGYRVVLLDFPGWGKSDSVVCTSSRSDLNASVVVGLLDTLKIERAHLVGNSMGGHSAVALTLSRPERVGKLVLMGGGTGGASIFTPSPAEGIKLLNAVYREPSEENLRKMLSVFVFDPSRITPDLFQKRLESILARPDHLENFIGSLSANPVQFPDVGPRLPSLVAPTLILWGRNDRFVPMDVGLRLLAGIPHSELHVFNGCGHWVQWEQAERFNRLVLDFLA